VRVVVVKHLLRRASTIRNFEFCILEYRTDVNACSVHTACTQEGFDFRTWWHPGILAVLPILAMNSFLFVPQRTCRSGRPAGLFLVHVA
jgi:hypothetical protein